METHGQVFYDKFGLTFIEMPRFTKGVSELSTELDRWLYLLKNLSNLNDVPVALMKPAFDKVFSVAEVCNLNRDEKMAWDAYLKAKWDNENSMEYVRKEAIREGRELGEEIGKEIGKEIGEELGKEIGKEIGREESKLEIARNMKAKGFDIGTISEITGLSREEVKNA